MAKKLAKAATMGNTISAIHSSLQKMDYQNPEVQAMHQQMMQLTVLVEGMQGKLLASLDKENMAVFHRSLLEQELDRWKEEGIALGLEYAAAGGATELDIHPEQMKAVIDWLTGQGTVDVSIYYREEFRDLVIEMAEFIKREQQPYQEAAD